MREIAPVTPLTEIGKRLHMLDAEMRRLEKLGVLDCPAYRQIDDEHERLIKQAMTMQPVTLKDAAALALCVADHAGYLTDHIVPPEDAEPYHERIELANSSILLALVKAGIKTDDIGPHDAEYEIWRHQAFAANNGAADRPKADLGGVA
jgi:hypothetical protein